MLVLSSFVVLTAFFAGGKGDREAGDEEFPFQVSVKSLNYRHMCGGAIIAPKWILTSSDCLKNNYDQNVLVSYGSADCEKQPKTVTSAKIHHQNGHRKNGMALIELPNDVQFGTTVGQAKLPTHQVILPNATKLSGWKVNRIVYTPPHLFVIDKFNVITRDCRSLSGQLVDLAQDEFCGVDAELPGDPLSLTNGGTVVSKAGIILGIATQNLMAPIFPAIFVKVSDHGQWIKDVLGPDNQYATWEDKVPTDAASSHFPPASLFFLAISAVCLRYF